MLGHQQKTTISKKDVKYKLPAMDTANNLHTPLQTVIYYQVDLETVENHRPQPF